MPEVTDAELAAALQSAEDESGVDQRLAAATAAMTPKQRQQCEDGLRRLIEAARRTREADHAKRSDV